MMHTRFHSNAVAPLLALVFLLLTVAPVRAHGYIVRAIPEDRAVLERPPTRIQYWFSEDLEPTFSEIALLDAAGQLITTGAVDANDNALMTLRPPGDLPDGAYVVSLRPAFASDGHVVAETRVFFVGESVAGVGGAAASDQPVRLEIVWRGIVLTSTTLLLGVTTLYVLVLRPVWGSKRHTAGFLPPRVMTQLFWMVGAALVVAVVGNGLALLQNASVLFNTGLGGVLRNGTWNTARIGSRFGDVWTVRMMLLGVFAGFYGMALYWRHEKPRTVAPTWHALMWLSALIVGTFAVSSHASGSLVLPWVAMLSHWLHMVAVAVWTGGLAALTLLLPVALRPYTGEQRRIALLAVLRRFSRLAVAALLLTITSGIYNSLNWLWRPVDVVQTSYGMALIYKLLLTLGLVALGAVHHIAARPEQYRRFAGWVPQQITLPLEVAFAAVVLLAAGVVSATPVPTPDFIGDGAPPPRAAVTVDNLTIDFTISPGGLGVNTYDARLNGTAPTDNTAVWVRQVRPSTDERGDWLRTEPIEDGLYVAAGDEINAEGAWVTLVDVGNAEQGYARYAYTWDITDNAGVIESLAPRPQHWAALAAMTAALLWTIYPAYRAFLRQMQFDTLTGTLLLVAVAVTVGMGILGFRYVAGLEAQNAALLRPAPVVVNTNLPDARSLEQGAAAFLAACDWDSNGRTFAALVERLPRTRDDELYAAVTEGWRDLPACDLAAEPATWDVVNYLRTYEPR